MARIRTIKPDFFIHEGLFDAEGETGLPLRLAFAGLWTQCDREGRFAWRPRQLKVAILPYDDVDFSRVLDALSTRGFIVKYTSENREFGYVPSWQRHQIINNRERPSDIPQPPEKAEEVDASTTRAPRVPHATQGEREGKEGNITSSSRAKRATDIDPIREEFERNFWPKYPRKVGKQDAIKAYIKARKQTSLDTIITELNVYVRKVEGRDEEFIRHPARWLNAKPWDDGAGAPMEATVPDEKWNTRLGHARKHSQWSSSWGPMPAQAGCLVPQHLLQPTDGAGWREWEKAA